MTKTKLFGIFALAMFCLNIALIFFLVIGRPNHIRPIGPKMIIIEKLDLSPTQVEQYEHLTEEHQFRIMEINQAINGEKAKLFTLLKGDYNADAVNAITQNIAEKQIEIEKINYHHFEQLKEICKGDQIEKFNKLTDELINLFNRETGGTQISPEHPKYDKI